MTERGGYCAPPIRNPPAIREINPKSKISLYPTGFMRGLPRERRRRFSLGFS